MSSYWKILFKMVLALLEQILQIPPEQDHQPMTKAAKAIVEDQLEKGA